MSEVSATHFSHLQHFRAHRTPDSVEFFPTSPQLENGEGLESMCAVSSYELVKDEGRRTGHLSLFDCSVLDSVKEVYSAETKGLLDSKWKPHSDALPLLASVTSAGTAEVRAVRGWEERGSKEVEVTTLCETEEEGSLALALEWCSKLDRQHENICVSYTSGTVAVYAYAKEALAEVWKQESAHDMECWGVTSDEHDPHVIYTGADDCTFRGWDTRVEPAGSPTFNNRKSHTMGVCCIQTMLNDETKVLTGSYDEYVRVFDKRMMMRPVTAVRTEGGGVWRLKVMPTGHILTASMHAGTAVVDIENCTVVSLFDKHESMSYGVDFKRGGNENEPFIGACSFYDNAIYFYSHPPLQQK
uniref:methylated diphthine methylhydrolase n=2 Tax=Palpitomonas bilix TaxID=652834 RepID=A0A7S3GAK8_9EUKA|mmetsp:Transcript_40600/g.105394  ORF Transcript_40600/g.105394 Transcript_40600/m.105394 type:complete len:357 (+) Transcript_40600:131-1201(+)